MSDLTEVFRERPITHKRMGRDSAYDWHEGEHHYRAFFDHKPAAGRHHYEVSFGIVKPNGETDQKTTINGVDATNVAATAIKAARHHIRHVVGSDKTAAEAHYHFSAVTDHAAQTPADSKRQGLYQRVIGHQIDQKHARSHPMFKGADSHVEVTPHWTKWSLRFPPTINQHMKSIEEANRAPSFRNVLRASCRVIGRHCR